MGDRTGIEWTDATWNPVTGCTKVSPGCDHCYAEGIAHRFAGTKAYPNGFEVTLRQERLDQPLRWRRPRRVFVNSMSDLFHHNVPDKYIAMVFSVMAAAPQHTFQVLTKRHARMRALLKSETFREQVFKTVAVQHPGDVMGDYWPLPNVWLGVSTESQQWADTRIPALLSTPAAVRFISAEPLLGPIDLARVGAPPFWCLGHGRPTVDCPNDLHLPRHGIDWVIVGGESGPGARPMHPDWVRHLRDQCTSSGVPFLFKQWGEWAPSARPSEFVDADGHRKTTNDLTALTLPASWAPVRRVGKKVAGRELDGRTWDQYPKETADA
ncbi:phage Gp37/Gp68 family protein [Rhodococcus ruber]|uniref:DUF5131 family protein n=1 Tax=Rhodococcus ruber TaxID=1830 RepID=UPI0019326D9A|nr:phage Gp37/Gp68 family protein [Rhodococcus ruber]QRE81862.1 phage Gp37/Gp68 family protein [Rhodococcus ruber]